MYHRPAAPGLSSFTAYNFCHARYQYRFPGVMIVPVCPAIWKVVNSNAIANRELLFAHAIPSCSPRASPALKRLRF